MEQEALRRDLFNQGALTQREFEDGQKAQAEAQRNVDETRLGIADTERMLTEARIAEALARLTPQSPTRPPQGTIRYIPGSGPIIVPVSDAAQSGIHGCHAPLHEGPDARRTLPC